MKTVFGTEAKMKRLRRAQKPLSETLNFAPVSRRKGEFYGKRLNAADDNPVTVRFHCQRGCCDHHEWCRFWASVGECRSNREWMADNCQLVCGSCRPGSARTSRPPDASSLARPPPRMPRPGTNQASNPRNPRPSGRRPSSRTTQRDRPSVQARAQDRRPQRPASTTLPRTTPRTTQRILPFSRATRPLRTRPNLSINDTPLHGISSRRQSANRTTSRPPVAARGQHLNSSHSQIGTPSANISTPSEMDSRRPIPADLPQTIKDEPEQNRLLPQASPPPIQVEELRPQPALPQP
ncbi:shTK domain protein [Teladorsagia circumcincta]|uniref:ShTK domain protein n=1 Tax=Teladorsagia circumcincta TaxID=45464 RepID=A0A2G9UEC1_TELCI|nr:shTK domain protein [Teladorsagia circumcincta]